MHLKRPSAAWIVAVVALVFAVGTGSAIGAHLITGKQIKNGSLTGLDIKSHSLALSDLSSGTVNAIAGRDGRNGAPGPAGPPGAVGPTGPAGPPGPSAISKMTRVASNGSIGPGQVSHVDATCPSGQTVVTGGFITAGVGEVFYSDTFSSTTVWSVGYDNFNGSQSAMVTAVAYCAVSGQAVGASRSVASVDREADARDAAQRAARAG